MKVVQILPELNAGGVERGTLEIADHLVRHGHEALVVSNGGRMVPALEKLGARHMTMPVHRKSLLSLTQVRPLRQLLENERPDILHIRSRIPGWIAYLAWRGMNPQTRPRLVSTVHGFYSVNRYSAIMTKGERVIAVSNSIRDYICQNYPSTNPEIIRVIHRGVAPKDFPRGYQPSAEWLSKWQTEHPQLAGKKILLLPGRITRWKGQEDFIHLIAALRANETDAHGLIAGEVHKKKHNFLTELRKLTAKLGVEHNITFLGHRNDLQEIMAVSNIVYSLSLDPEAFGRVTLEAVGIGCPVIGYDHGGVAEQLAKLYPRGLVTVGDRVKLLNKTLDLLSQPEKPANISAPFTLEDMKIATIDVYRELLDT